MNRMRRSTEQGQSLVLIAIAAIALIAFVSLAIDGGMAYSQRRVAQNAADAGAMAGAYEIRLQNRQESWSQSELRDTILEAVTLHGVVLQMDGDNARNVGIYYTDDKGTVLNTCPVGTCGAGVASSAWGVKVDVANPFDTFFAGVIGWHEMNVGATSLGVVRAGARSNTGFWAIVATAKHWSSNNAPLSIGGGGGGKPSDNEGIIIVGSLHSNGKYDGPPSQNFTYSGQITYDWPDYSTGCKGCEVSDPPAERKHHNIVYPTYADYLALALEAGVVPIGNKTLSGSGQSLGSVAQPITYINGNLSCGNGATLYGLIVVTGSATIENGTSCKGSYLIAAQGNIVVKGDNMTFAENQLYQNSDYELLAKNGNRFVTASHFDMQGSGNNMLGGIIAEYSLSIQGSSNQIIGHLIGDSVSISGSGHTITYENEFFPPQPDYIELLQ